MFKCRQKSLVSFNKMMVVGMHPLLCYLCIVHVQQFFAIHCYGRTYLLRQPISFGSEDSCSLAPDALRWGRCNRNCKVLDSKPLKILKSVSWCFPPSERTVVDLGIDVLNLHLEVISKEKLTHFMFTQMFAVAVLSWSSGVILSPPMPFNKMASMLVGVLVGWGGSEDFSGSMGSSDDVTAEPMSIANFRMSFCTCVWMTMR